MRFLTRLSLLFICISTFVSATPSIYLEYSIEKPSYEALIDRHTLKSDQGYDIEIRTNPFHKHTIERNSPELAIEDLNQKGQNSYSGKSAYY